MDLFFLQAIGYITAWCTTDRLIIKVKGAGEVETIER